MDHFLVQAIEKALGWTGSSGLGVSFARGTAADPELYTRLLTPSKLLDVIMRRSLAPPQLRCFQNGNELHPDACLTQQVTRRGQTLPVANMDCLGQLLRSGCTVVLDALDSFDPTMEIACRALQWWSREVVQVNTYLTTNDAAGFSLHWDDHDVVIVQIAGEKSWEVRGTSRLVPMYRDAEPNREPSNEVVWSGTMRAGDVMHIPRGYWHQATRADLGAGYRSDPDRDLLEHALSLGVRGLDTAFNYRDFTSHTQLARAAGELLGEFTVSTKVGFFPGDDSAAHAVHSLDRARLWEVVERSVDDLGRSPDVVFLHSPERSLAGMPTGEGRDRLTAACHALADAVTAGLCTAWGIASWDARPVVHTMADVAGVRPDVLLLRAGLSVADPVLSAAEQLALACAVSPDQRWGMSPFGGSTNDDAWRSTNLGAFLQQGQHCSTPQAAFRLAYELPAVAKVAVGTRSVTHLRELVEAADLVVDDQAVTRYRKLIRAEVTAAHS